MTTIFFDLETGGLEPGVHPITQVGAIAVDEHFRAVDEIELKIQFDPGECSDESLEMNSFDPRIWEDQAVPPAAARMQLTVFLHQNATVRMRSRRGRTYYVAQLAGHNAAKFDGPFLQHWYKDAGEFLPAHFTVLDTLQLAHWVYHFAPNPPENLKLRTLCDHLGVGLPEGEAHDALRDVRATVELARRLAPGMLGGRA